MYAVGEYNEVAQRYSFSQHRWQPIAKLSNCSHTERRHYAGATVFNSKLYVIYGHTQWNSQNQEKCMLKAELFYFDPSMNRWDFLSNTCEPHFESTLFVVNNKLGGTSLKEDTNQVVRKPVLRCMTGGTRTGQLFNKGIFPITILVQLRWKGGCISSLTNFQLTVGLGSHQGNGILFIWVSGKICQKLTKMPFFVIYQ